MTQEQTSSAWTGPVDEALRAHVARCLEAAPEGIWPIVQAGHPVLRTPAAAYDGQLGDLLPDLLDAMRLTMLDAPGVGLAAPQIGLGLAIAVIWDPGSADPADPRERTPVAHRTLVNPVYTPSVDAEGVETTVSFYEGCLSVPGWHAVRARHRSVRLTGQDADGVPLDEVLTGWPARIVQHETDHLRGELYVDRAEMRSLSTDAAMSQYWASTPDPSAAARILGFDLDPVR